MIGYGLRQPSALRFEGRRYTTIRGRGPPRRARPEAGQARRDSCIHCSIVAEKSVRCLALNASFEPLTMVPVRRALRLVIEGKAEIVESDAGESVRSERLTLPKPAIIRLVKFVHVPRRFRRQVTNTFLFARDSYRCQYCHRARGSCATANASPAITSCRSLGVGTTIGRMS